MLANFRTFSKQKHLFYESFTLFLEPVYRPSILFFFSFFSYEFFKTEDIPNLSPNARFNAESVSHVAMNILSFLKRNATKEGHTYWLFKRKNDPVVKLYDLTSLCETQLSTGIKI